MRFRHIAPLLCLLLASCTTTSHGQATPETTTSASTDSTSPSPTDDNADLPTNGAPKVDNPLDTTRYQDDPCATLTASQATDLNLPATGERTSVARGVGCEWENPDIRGSVLIGFLTGIHSGLSSAYATNEAGDFAYFVPLPEINGYPAVAADIEDRRSRGICTIAVGVTDKLVSQVTVHLSTANVDQKDPCEVTADVADMALQTMKAGA